MKKTVPNKKDVNILLSSFTVAGYFGTWLQLSDKGRVLYLLVSAISALCLCFGNYKKVKALFFSIGIIGFYILIFLFLGLTPISTFLSAENDIITSTQQELGISQTKTPSNSITQTFTPVLGQASNTNLQNSDEVTSTIEEPLQDDACDPAITPSTTALSEQTTTPVPVTLNPSDYPLPSPDVHSGVIVNSETKLQLAPSAFSTSAQYENRTAIVIAPGDTVQPIGRDGEWAYVKYHSTEGDAYGYIPSTLLAEAALASLDPMPNADTQAVIIEDAYMRSQPKADSSAQAKVIRSTLVTLLGFATDDWVYTKLVVNGTIVYGYLPKGVYKEIGGSN